MAGVLAIHSVGSSLVRLLDLSFPGAFGGNDIDFTFRLVSTGEMTAAATENLNNTLTLMLYRVTTDEHLRNGGGAGSRSPIPLDLHYLLTVWSDSALNEHAVLAWAMRELHHNSILDSSTLSAEGGWERGDTVHLIPAELSNEDMMRIWDALEPPYRLSVSYIARVIRIGPDAPGPEFAPVVASRFQYSGQVEGGGS